VKKKSTIKSDLARIDRMKDSDIDYSDIPELDDSFFERATEAWPRLPDPHQSHSQGGNGQADQPHPATPRYEKATRRARSFIIQEKRQSRRSGVMANHARAARPRGPGAIIIAKPTDFHHD
jgi:hypothetical protein